jgi:hypothetical protein
MKNDTLTFSDLKRGQDFVVLPGDGYRRCRDGDWLRENYLFSRVNLEEGNAVRTCDNKIFKIPDSVPVIRVNISGRAAGKRRRR